MIISPALILVNCVGFIQLDWTGNIKSLNLFQIVTSEVDWVDYNPYNNDGLE